jgi:hypothetical protein
MKPSTTHSHLLKQQHRRRPLDLRCGQPTTHCAVGELYTFDDHCTGIHVELLDLVYPLVAYCISHVRLVMLRILYILYIDRVLDLFRLFDR